MKRVGLTRSRDEAGGVAVIVAITAVILMVMAGFAVDIGKTWAKRGQLQVQADQTAVATSSALPVKLADAADRKRVAKYAAFSLACNKVTGQSYNLPECTSALTPSSSTLDAAATEMLSNGALGRAPGVSFPSSTSVQITTPVADIDYTFGRAAGVQGVTEVKKATAQVSSPGQMLPIALSKVCGLRGTAEMSQENLPALRGQADANLAMFPTRVIALGDRADAPVRSYTMPALPPFAYPASFSVPRRSGMDLKVHGPTLNVAGLTPYTWEVGKTAALLSVAPASGSWGAITAGQDNVHFWKQDGFGGWTLAASVRHAGTIGGGTITLPSAVINNPGSYYVTAAAAWISLNGGFQTVPASQAKQINIASRDFPADALTRMDQGAGSEAGTCARYIDSPRLDTASGIADGTTVSDSTLIKNIQGGMDHRLSVQQNLAGTCTGSTVVRDVTVHVDGSANDPNCVRITSKNVRAEELTTAWLGNAGGAVGRLDCSLVRFTSRSNCEHATFTLGKRQFNNDDLSDYVTSEMTDLSDWRNFGTANFDSDGIPLTSPPNTKLSEEIYYSPRLFWAPVISTPGSNIPGGNLDGTEFPVWTYRPVWLGRQQDDVGSLQAGTTNNLWCTSDLGDLDRRDREYSEYRDGLDEGKTNGSYSGVIVNGVARGGSENDRVELFGCTRDDPKNMTSSTAFRRVKGLRFQTIEPVSMPEPPEEYDGPLTDYVGTGPRVVRLVK